MDLNHEVLVIILLEMLSFLVLTVVPEFKNNSFKIVKVISKK